MPDFGFSRLFHYVKNKFWKKKTFKKIDIGLETQLLELTNWTFNLETICVVKIAELTQYLSARPFQKTS